LTLAYSSFNNKLPDLMGVPK